MISMGRKEWPLEKQPVSAMMFCITCWFFHHLLLNKHRYGNLILVNLKRRVVRPDLWKGMLSL